MTQYASDFFVTCERVTLPDDWATVPEYISCEPPIEQIYTFVGSGGTLGCNL